MAYPNKEVMIETIMEYYNHGWESGDMGELYDDLDYVYRNGYKGLENEPRNFLEGEYNNAKQFMDKVNKTHSARYE